MKQPRIYLLIVLLFNLSILFAQEKKIQRVDKKYDKLAYIKTSEVLLKVAEDGYESAELFMKLGNSFYFNNKMRDAVKWYAKLMEMEDVEVDPEYYFRYSQALKSIEKYEEADNYMRKFNEEKPEDSRAAAFINDVDYLATIEAASNYEAKVYNLPINSKLSDFGGYLYNGKIYFSSTRGGGKNYNWNEQPFLEIYTATNDGDNKYGEVVGLGEPINTKVHESSIAITPDGKFLFFTRNNFYDKKKTKGKDGVNRLQIYRAIKKGESWADIQPVHFNSSEYSVAHPSINAEGTAMYFASDMEGNVGLSDIFRANLKPDGTLGNPENLGPLVNTEGEESFPFINSKGDLYFASNGYPGLGSLDIFVIRDFEKNFAEGGMEFKVENIGKPINSPMDDFAYYESVALKQGFFTSNRKGGKGDDDIYGFTILDCEQNLNGIVKDLDSTEPISDAVVSLYDSEGNLLETKNTDEKGLFKFLVNCDKDYLVRVEQEKYIGDEKRIVTPKTPQDLQMELFMELDAQEVGIGDDLAKTLDIPIIYFDFDDSKIRYDASVELEKVLVVLKTYPSMKLDIRSHTDSRGEAPYNLALSDRRAKSTREYLIGKGIDPERLIANGFGESEPVNKCTDGVECSEEEHQLNRRSEFIISGM